MRNPYRIAKAIWALPQDQRRLWLLNRLRTGMNLPARHNSPDRSLLEERLLPHYGEHFPNGTSLFVGCDWYTKHYPTILPSHKFWTMDPDAAQAKYGAPMHLVQPMQVMEKFFEPGSLDLIVCNGVFGYGLNTESDLQSAAAQSFSCLKPGGELLFGWNDIPQHAPFDPSTTIFKAGFERRVLPVLGQWRITLDMPTRHTFEVYRRPV